MSFTRRLAPVLAPVLVVVALGCREGATKDPKIAELPKGRSAFAF